MPEKIKPSERHGDGVRDLIQHSKSPREMMVVIKSLTRMLEDQRSGRLRGDGIPNFSVQRVQEILDERSKNKEFGGLEVAIMGGQAATDSIESDFENSIELAWARFVALRPSREDIQLLAEQVPSFADRANSLLSA